TLTATPIPRTLQFSLMGARDLSIIQTPPPNRQPIETELCLFAESVIRDAVNFEMSRGGQVFFISNRVENLAEMAGLVQRACPDAKVAIAHGQMDGKDVETTLLHFLEGDIDVLVATSIIENGLDIPNANTMIINNAQQFGLSDLHQMRGRVGRSNRKAFCYMMVPSFDIMTEEAKKRLRAVSEFNTIGSGFNIAMRDLDIRGAGNILGAEQSGFIADIGYEAYHKILNEAIEELKETDFRDLFVQEAGAARDYVKECQVETDLSVLLPDEYVSNVSERLVLYKELNGLSSEEQLLAYRQRLIDRFGPVPHETDELIKTITLRRIAKDFGIEKVVLRKGVMLCYFASGKDNPFYQSPNFNHMITFASSHSGQALLKEQADRLCLRCEKVRSIYEAVQVLQEMIGGHGA
ncbi:MAG: TRCF domain-containing protein, partial [Bacteroidales bacterium]|nr:TRCF domain-containing protein [Bacteroidales bacterium]